MADIIKTEAIILSSIRWKESSEIVTIFGKSTGKIKIIARGALKSNGPFAGKLQSLFFVEVIIDSKKSRTLQILKEIEVINSFSKIRLNFKIYPYVLSVLEIVHQVFDESQSDEVFFNFIIEIINAFTENTSPENIFIYFLLKLSSYLGFRPYLENCTSGDISLCEDKVFLSISKGTIFCKKCFVESENPLLLQKEQFFYLKNLQNIHHRRIKSIEIHRSDFAQIIQNLLKYINYHIEQNLTIAALNLINK